MRRREHQSGFSATVILLAVLVVAVLAVTGLVVYQHHKPSNAKNSAATSSTPTTTQPKSTTTPQPAQSTTQYFTITEWGVRAPNTTTDTFTYNVSSDGKSAYVKSAQLANKDSACTYGSAGTIVRYSPTDYTDPYNQGPTVQQQATQTPSLYVHIGNYYYIFRHTQSQCGSVSITDLNNANDEVKALAANLQAIPN